MAAIVDLLLDDPLGAGRESADGGDGLRPYVNVFDAIDVDPAHLLLVVVDDSALVATMQLSPGPGLARRGAVRCERRSKGSGSGRSIGAVGWDRQ